MGVFLLGPPTSFSTSPQLQLPFLASAVGGKEKGPDAQVCVQGLPPLQKGKARGMWGTGENRGKAGGREAWRSLARGQRLNNTAWS